MQLSTSSVVLLITLGSVVLGKNRMNTCRQHKIVNFIGAIVFFTISLPIVLFAQTNGTWTTASSADFTERSALTSCVVGGKIYVIGGYNWDIGGALDSLDIFDPQTNSWS